MKSWYPLLLVVVFILTGCVTASKMNRLNIGMTKQEVLAAMGQPSSTASPGGGVEILRYYLSTTDNEAFYGGAQEFFVKLSNGKVESYGKMGDFDSTKDPTVNLNIKNR